MKSAILSKFTMIYLPAIGFILFAVLFLISLIWVFRPQSKEFYENMSKIPLGDDHE